MEKRSTEYREGNSMLLVSVIACSAFVGLTHLNKLVSNVHIAENYVQTPKRDTILDSSLTNRLSYILIK